LFEHLVSVEAQGASPGTSAESRTAQPIFQYIFSRLEIDNLWRVYRYTLQVRKEIDSDRQAPDPQSEAAQNACSATKLITVPSYARSHSEVEPSWSFEIAAAETAERRRAD
jgi:hypothetical protein